MTLGRLQSKMAGLCALTRLHPEAGCRLQSPAWHAEIHLALMPAVLGHLLWRLGLVYMFYVGSPECTLIDIKGVGPSFMPSSRMNHMPVSPRTATENYHKLDLKQQKFILSQLSVKVMGREMKMPAGPCSLQRPSKSILLASSASGGYRHVPWPVGA